MFTFIVLSSDGYSDCWNPFFTLLQRYFPEVSKQQILLSTNSKEYSFEGLPIETIQHGDVPWSKRFKNTLLKARNEVVFVLVEDFFLRSRIDPYTFNLCENLISEESNKIDHIRMLSILKTKIAPSEFENLDKIARKTDHRYVLMPGLWRRSSLLQYISDHESPYMNEIMGNIKSKFIKHNFYTYSHVLSRENGNFYNSATAGAIYKGKWAKWVPNFFKDERIEMDYSIRGFRTKEYRKKAKIKSRLSILNDPVSLFKSFSSLIEQYFRNLIKLSK